ncbi:hypothetical protein ACYULU_15470 [Breznakiellaceae bacterium SP9]
MKRNNIQDDFMREEYGFSNSMANPYIKGMMEHDRYPGDSIVKAANHVSILLRRMALPHLSLE